MIPSAALRPASLNYFGLLGPEGKDFGQIIYYLSDVLLLPDQHLDLSFNVSSDPGEGAPHVDV